MVVLTGREKPDMTDADIIIAVSYSLLLELLWTREKEKTNVT
jgi:hypothetical protein